MVRVMDLSSNYPLEDLSKGFFSLQDGSEAKKFQNYISYS